MEPLLDGRSKTSSPRAKSWSCAQKNACLLFARVKECAHDYDTHRERMQQPQHVHMLRGVRWSTSEAKRSVPASGLGWRGSIYAQVQMARTVSNVHLRRTASARSGDVDDCAKRTLKCARRMNFDVLVFIYITYIYVYAVWSAVRCVLSGWSQHHRHNSTSRIRRDLRRRTRPRWMDLRRGAASHVAQQYIFGPKYTNLAAACRKCQTRKVCAWRTKQHIKYTSAISDASEVGIRAIAWVFAHALIYRK